MHHCHYTALHLVPNLALWGQNLCPLLQPHTTHCGARTSAPTSSPTPPTAGPEPLPPSPAPHHVHTMRTAWTHLAVRRRCVRVAGEERHGGLRAQHVALNLHHDLGVLRQ
eukprot:360781-Chlamydomonas_euryale.AAC.4